MYQKYIDRAAFYVVYIEEAHATDGWRLSENEKENVVYAMAKSIDERAGVASTCVKDLGIQFPALVDTLDNSTETAYTAWPDRLYVIDRGGRIAFKSKPGPFGFKPDGVAATLKRLLEKG